MKTKQKKINVRVDFTPMVDMMMLLITFFMLCTSLSKPKTMEINMPTNKDDIKEEQQNKVKASEAITLIFDKDNKIYYYNGIPEMGSLKETKYDEKGGLREMLLQRNLNAIQKVKKLRQEFAKQQVAGNALAEEKAQIEAAEIAKEAMLHKEFEQQLKDDEFYYWWIRNGSQVDAWRDEITGSGFDQKKTKEVTSPWG